MNLKEIRTKLNAILGSMQFVKVSTDKGILDVAVDEVEAIAEGITVTIVDEEGNPSPVEDGEYVLEDERTLVIENGVIVAIKPAPEKEPEAPAEEPAEEMAEEEPATEEPKAEEPTEQTEIEKLREEVNELYKIVDSILDKIGESRKEADGFSARLSKVEEMSAAVSVEKPVLKKVDKTAAALEKFNKMFNK